MFICAYIQRTYVTWMDLSVRLFQFCDMQFLSYWSKTKRSAFARRRVKQEVSAPFCNAFTIWAKVVGVWSVSGRTVKTESHMARRAHAVPLPCLAAKGLHCVFPIWFAQWDHIWFTLAMPCPCRANAMLWPCRSSQGHDTVRPSKDGLWTTCLL